MTLLSTTDIICTSFSRRSIQHQGSSFRVPQGPTTPQPERLTRRNAFFGWAARNRTPTHGRVLLCIDTRHRLSHSALVELVEQERKGAILSSRPPHSACEPPGILTLRRKLTKNGELHLPRMRERMPQ
jgi:hypothetical protein